MIARSLLLAALLGAAGCGGSTGVVLIIDSDYLVPVEVDQVGITVFGTANPEKTVLRPVSQPFPHSLAVVTTDVTGTVVITIQAMKGTDVVTSTQINADLVQNRMLEYRISL